MKNDEIIKHIATAMDTRIGIKKTTGQLPATTLEIMETVLREVQAEDNVVLAVVLPGNKEKCPRCGSILEKREIALYKGLFEALALVYDWCHKHNTHTFKMHDIRDLIGHNEYARFGDWVFFGGLVYKEGKANYGLNMDRCEDFLFGSKMIPLAGWKDPVTNEFLPSRWGNRHEIFGLEKFLDDNKMYRSRYTHAPVSLFDKPMEQ